jgi:chitodextrinase
MKKSSCWYSTSRHLSIVVMLILSGGFLFARQAHAAISFAQQNANTFRSVSRASISFSSATTAGDLVIVGIYVGPSSSISSVTDSQANVYTQIGAALSLPTNSQSTALFYAKNIKSGSDTVTVQLTAVPQFPGLGIYIFEYNGVDTVSPLDGNSQAAGSSSTVSSGNLTATVSGDLVFGFCVSDATCSRGSGFTARSTFEGNLAEDKTLTAAGTTSAIGTSDGAWVMQAAAFKPPPPDTTPPSVPTELTAMPVSTSQINLSWTASTDPDSPVAGYNIYRNNVRVGAAAGTSYSDTGLAANTTYSYTVSAYDPAGNVSSQSSAVSATTLADTTPPSVPTGLAATAVSTSQINLSWTASTDPDSPVAGYNIYRNGTQVGTTAGTSYSDTGLSANATYSYTVSANDPAGNVSSQSSAVSATTLAPDTTAPSVPTGLAATPVSPTEINLSWTASTDPDSSVAGYNIYRNGSQVGTTAGTSYSDTGLSANTTYSYTVSANDPEGNVSAQSSAVSATTLLRPVIPTAVQHIGSKVTGPYFQAPGDSYMEYDIRFDTPVLSGNCIIVGVSWSASGVSPTVTDDKNNSYTAGPSTSDGNRAIGIWYLLNATNGPRLIQARFPTQTRLISLIASEFYNIATSSVSDGTSGGTGTSGSAVTAGAISTTVDNDLIWQFGLQESGVAMTKWTPASNWNLICPDIQETGQAAQYTVQASHGSITPTLTQSPTNHAWITVAMGFKSAASGTVPTIPMRIVQHTHTALDNNAPSGSTIETSVTGNLLVLTWVGYTDCIISSITDSAGNTWKDVNPGSVPGPQAGSAQTWYVANISPAAALVITVNFTGPDEGSGSTIHLFDIVNAAASPLDTITTASGNNDSTTSWVGASITPGTPRGLVIFSLAVYYNTVLASSQSTFFMSITTPEYEASYVDNNNGGAVSYHTDTRTIQNTWTSNVPPVSWAEIDASFIEAPDLQPPTAPTNLTAVGSAGQATLNWTVATDSVGVVLYNVYRSATSGFAPAAGNKIGQVSATSTSYTDFVTTGTYYYLVTAQDAAANVGPASNEASATVSSDTTPPFAPTNLAATAISFSQINLSWTASTDPDSPVAGYNIYRNGAQVGTATGTAYSDTGLAASTTYTYTVTAFDPSGNLSPASQPANATTFTPSPLPAGLIAAYTFSEGTGTTTADDSGNGNTGTLVNGPVWSTGKYGYALSYNGVNSYVSLGNTLDIAALPFTIAAWVNPTNYNDYRKIFSKRNNWAANAMRVDL